jgi:hypothetical protein
MNRRSSRAGAIKPIAIFGVGPRAHWLVLFVSVLSFACNESAPAKTPAPPSPAPKANAAASRTEGAARPPQQVTFRAEAAPTFRTHQQLLDLADGVRLTRKEFELLQVRAASPGAIQASQRGALLLLLDDQSPRPLLEASVPLRSLVDEDRELSPGWHVLVAFVGSTDATDLQIVHFQLELDLPDSRASSQCLLLEPAGTVVLPAGGSVRLVAAPLSPQTKQLEYSVGGEPASVWRAPALESVRASGLPSGDHRLGVRCYDDAGVLVGESLRTVTVNRDEELGK